MRSTECDGVWELAYAAICRPCLALLAIGLHRRRSSPVRVKLNRDDNVTFVDRHLQTHASMTTRCNPEAEGADVYGDVRNVSCGDLRRGLDIGCPASLVKRRDCSD